MIDVDGTNTRRLTANRVDDYFPDWSPDGAQIAFTSDRDGDAEIFTMQADGTGVRKLTSNDAEDQWPDWSPDGSRIVFWSDRGESEDIFVMNARGGDSAG